MKTEVAIEFQKTRRLTIQTALMLSRPRDRSLDIGCEPSRVANLLISSTEWAKHGFVN